MKRIALLVVAAFAIAIPVTVASGSAKPAASKNIVGVAASDPQFSTLVSLVKKAGLVGALSGKTKLTVFAPTNAAFAKLPKRQPPPKREIVAASGATRSAQHA